MDKSKPSINIIFKISGLIIFLIISLLIVLQQGFFSKGKQLEIYSDTNNTPALATGDCTNNSDCLPTGCSSQICASHELITTCELGQFPEKETYSCGCRENHCVWYRFR